MTTSDAGFFSPNYETARRRFRSAAANAGLHLETHTIASAGPDGIDLSLDAAIAGNANARQAMCYRAAYTVWKVFWGQRYS
jgi:hypothetical protein